jgi:hypothetical protein
MPRHRFKTHLTCASLAFVLATACAAAPQAPAAAASTNTYEGRCTLLGLEALESPDRRDSDSISLVARYSFDSGHADSGTQTPLEFLFQVSRSRLADARSHLTSHPTVLCRPERIDLPPYRGERALSLTGE